MFKSARVPFVSLLNLVFSRFGVIAIAPAFGGLWSAVAVAQEPPVGLEDLAPPSRAEAAQPMSVPSEEVAPAAALPEAARQAIAEQRHLDAVRILEPLATDESASFEVLLALAGAYDALALEAGADTRTPEARDLFREYRDKLITYYYRAGQAAVKAHDPRAQVILQRVLSYDPRNVKVLPLLARLSRQAGSNTQAIFYYKEYVKTPEGEGDFAAQVELGRLLVAENLWRQAVDVLEKARAVGGGEAERQLALAYLAGKQPEKATAAAERAIQRDPQSPDSYIVRASLRLSLGADSDPVQALQDTLRALELARAAVKSDPGNPQAWQRLMGQYSNLLKLSEALKAHMGARQTLEPAVRIGLADLVAGLGRLGQLLSDYESMLILRGVNRPEETDVEVLAALARRQRDLGQAQAAVQTAAHILERVPDHPLARQIQESQGRAESPAGGARQ